MKPGFLSVFLVSLVHATVRTCNLSWPTQAFMFCRVCAACHTVMSRLPLSSLWHWSVWVTFKPPASAKHAQMKCVLLGYSTALCELRAGSLAGCSGLGKSANHQRMMRLSVKTSDWRSAKSGGDLQDCQKKQTFS